MSEPLDVGQWARNWEAMARQAQAAMGTQGGTPGWNPSAPNAAWAEALGKLNPLAGGTQQNEAMERLLSGAQGYLGMLQSLAAAAGGKSFGTGDEGAHGFANGFFSGALPGMATGNPVAEAMRGFAGHGARGFDQMMEQFAAAAGPMFDKSRAVLQFPAFGHLREKQENLQKTARAFIDYQEQSARYDRLMLKVGEQSFARFQLKLAEREEPGRQIESVRALYDLWIDAAEEAYAEIALTEEFREVYAAVVDAQMRVRQQVQGEIEKFCNELGMPTRSEVDSIGERLQALRREFRKQWEADSGNEALKAELDTLRREVKSLKDAPAKTRAAKPAGTSKTVRPAARKSERSAEPAKKAAPARKGPTATPKPGPRSTSKPRRQAAKTTQAKAQRRVKRARPAAVVPARAAAAKVAARAPAKRGGGKSFAASIARFARKSKTSAASRVGPGTKKAASGRNGGNR